MQSRNSTTELYASLMKKLKFFIMIGELIIFLLRLLVQRLFSLYVGVVMLEVLICTIINFKNNSEAEAKLYIILNLVLLYLLIINFLEFFNNEENVIQNAYKDKFIVDYVKFGYPLEFAFRLTSMLIVWRIYQYCRVKLEHNSEFLPTQQQAESPRQLPIQHNRNYRINNQPQNNTTSLNGSQNDRNQLNINYLERSMNLQNIERIPRSIQNGRNITPRTQNFQNYSQNMQYFHSLNGNTHNGINPHIPPQNTHSNNQVIQQRYSQIR